MAITTAADSYAPRTIKLNVRDNVAIVVNDFGLPAGTHLPDGVTLRQFVPQGHKLALVEIPQDQPIIRYGEIIGYAIDTIAAGDWVEEARIHMPDAPMLDRLDIATATPAPQEPLSGYTFEGFRNPDGSVGIKNILAISTSVQCVAGTLEFAIKKIKAELLPRYPNVDE
jgi:galactarate dehydratase